MPGFWGLLAQAGGINWQILPHRGLKTLLIALLLFSCKLKEPKPNMLKQEGNHESTRYLQAQFDPGV